MEYYLTFNDLFNIAMTQKMNIELIENNILKHIKKIKMS